LGTLRIVVALLLLSDQTKRRYNKMYYQLFIGYDAFCRLSEICETSGWDPLISDISLESFVNY